MCNEEKTMNPTLAIYGIQDRYNYVNPVFVHDHNLCLMQDGKIIHYLHLERYTRRKYDNKLHEVIEDLIDNKVFEITENVDLINVNSFVGDGFVSKNGRLRIDGCNTKELNTDFFSARAYFQKNKREGFELSTHILNHELAHVFSNLPFYGLFHDNSLLVHFDGGASLSNFSAFVFRNNQIECIEYHWDMAHLSKFFNDNALAFAIIGAKPSEHCAVPGKLMGYATLGNPKTEYRNWLRENNYFKDCWNDLAVFFQKANHDFGYTKTFIDQHDGFIQDISSVFQYEFQEQVLDKILQLQQSTQTEYLYYAGGCALNIVTNTKIVDSKAFKDVFIPPCCSDSGLAMGAAAFAEWKKGNTIVKHTPYLNTIGIQNIEYQMDTELIREVAKLLTTGKMVGVSNGYAEVGLRALGNRSIFALANSKDLAKQVSMVCKQREWYRPIAPIMLEKNAKKVTGLSVIHHLSEYMLLDFDILPEYKQQIIGVVHQNNTSRIQTIFSRQQNPFVFDLLTYLDENFNIPALINTSFNSKGEPIVQTLEQALYSAKSMKLDAVVLNYQLTILK